MHEQNLNEGTGTSFNSSPKCFSKEQKKQQKKIKKYNIYYNNVAVSHVSVFAVL